MKLLLRSSRDGHGSVNALIALIAEVNKLRTDLDNLRQTFNAHVHSGVTAGGVNTAVSTTTQGALTAGTFETQD